MNDRTAELPPPDSKEEQPKLAAPAQPRALLPPPHHAKHGWVVWLVTIAILGGLGLLVWHFVKNPPGLAQSRKNMAPQTIQILAEKTRTGNLPIYLDGLLGTVTPVYTVTVHTRVDGQLMKVNWIEGQHVKQGDLLAQIDPDPYQAAVEQAQGALARDQATYDNAIVDLKRYTDAPDTVTPQQIDTQRATVAQDLGIVKSDQGQLDAAKVNLAYCTIYSPITGIAGLRDVDPGNIVHAADTNGLTTIAQLQPMTVEFPVLEDAIPEVLGKSDLRVDIYNRDPAIHKHLATGKLSATDSQVDTTTGTLKMKAIFKNEDGALFPNQFVNARVLVDTHKQVVLAPIEAIQPGPNSTYYAYVVKADNTVTIRTVVPGADDGDQTQEILSGLKNGELVVTDGMDKLQEGSKVEVHSANETTRPSTQASASDSTQPSGHLHHHSAGADN